MENYFILLELPFDPPEEDEAKICEVISKKHRQWCYDQVNPVKLAIYRENLAHLDDIKKVMLDPMARKQEAEKAVQIRIEKYENLRMTVRLLRVKSEVLSESDLRKLVQGYARYGFTAEDIVNVFNNTF